MTAAVQHLMRLCWLHNPRGQQLVPNHSGGRSRDCLAPRFPSAANLPAAGCGAEVRRRCNAWQRAAGFTLVELLVALVILAVMAGLAWRGIDSLLRTQERVMAYTDEVLAVQSGLAQWTADLDHLLELGTGAALEWNGRVLRLVRADAVEGRVRVVGWTRRDGQWLRWQSPPLLTRGEWQTAWQQADRWSQAPGVDERRGEIRVAPLIDWQLFYFRGDAWSNPLSSAATGTAARADERAPPTATAIPDGIRLVLQLPAAHPLAGRLTHEWVRPTVGGSKS